MTNPIPLNPVTLPLNQVNLIEASAGTGKTYTIGSLYLRLLLQAGEPRFARPLNVEEILVVTFTEMATEELKQKIRERLSDAIRKLSAYAQDKDESVFVNDAFLADLHKTLDDLPLAIRRLKLAEQNMDLAAIFTIHGFCRRMLMQYAFNSGVHFNLELVKDQSDLLKQFANEFWREHFYPQPFAIANFIAAELGSPDAVLTLLKSDLGRDLWVDTDYHEALSLSTDEFLRQYLGGELAAVQEIKQLWASNAVLIGDLIFAELNKNYSKGVKKSLNRKIYQVKRTQNWLTQINQWAENPHDYVVHDKLCGYFVQSAFAQHAEEGAMPLTAPIFSELETRVKALLEPDLLRKLILYHYRQGIRQKLFEHKRNHQEKSFDDLLRLLFEALQSERGEQLAEMMRFQYPFAMIDEFQDTDAQQYAIFSKIYRENSAENSGFIMIGDPKQAIYRFRGADIFTYFKAAEQADERFNLTKNYRSEQNVVNGVNALFGFSSSPFIYDDIEFSPVDAREDHRRFYLHGEREPAYRFYLTSDSLDSTALARSCAVSIQHWLKSAAQKQAFFQCGDDIKPLQAADIAVLVRDKNEAALVKNELQQLGIASVYLSDQSSVFDSLVAKELVFVLKACLQVTERSILNAIATALFGLNAAEIHQIRHSEQDWQRWADSFARYQQTWQYQGVLPMLHRLLLEQSIAERLLSRPTGERDLTDFLHLAEILQQAAILNDSEAALVNWLERQIQGEGRQEAQIRLESERQLIKIVTIHKSKGLEYDLVWLPFLAVPSRDPRKANNKTKDFNLYYSETQDAILWDMQNRHSAELYRESFAEELRLLYVALTRAKYQMAFALPTQFEKKWNPLLYVLTQGEIGEASDLPQAYAAEPLLEAFKARMPSVQISAAESLVKLPPLALSEQQETLCVAQFHGEIEQNWHVTSFTAIERAHRWQNDFAESNVLDENTSKSAMVFDEAKDYDGQIESETLPNSLAVSSEARTEASGLDLPHGTQTGTLLHRYLEKNDFGALADKTALEKLCQDLQLDEAFVTPLQKWFEQIAYTPFSTDPTLYLAALAAQDCIKEMPFYLAIRERFKVADFNRALQAHHHLPSESLRFDDIQGMLRGTIDLVFRHQGKYYLLDYKSNFLGENTADYAPSALQKAMLHHHYDWQYLLYCLALHRYLKRVDRDYDYERDFGGVFYLFLRGMNGEAQSGVFFDRPSVQLMQAIEEAF